MTGNVEKWFCKSDYVFFWLETQSLQNHFSAIPKIAFKGAD